METYLEVTKANVEELNEMNIVCAAGDELTCEVTYDINRADPNVGYSSDDVQITSVTCEGTNVERFLDMNKLHEEALEEYGTLE